MGTRLSLTRPRWRLLALATLLVLAAHALLLFGWAPTWIDPDDTPASPPALTVRSGQPPAPTVALPTSPAAPGPVVGARGGAEVWTFVVAGADRVGDTPALKLLREARRPRDTQVEIWLDPARAHLPLRALLSQPEGGAPFELRLEAGSTGP
jgi:hypothetical protein